MIFQRYIAKEILLTLVATLLVLLGIVLAQRLAIYLSQAATGLLAQHAILKLLGLQLLRFFTELLPLSFLLASLLALGRLYRDSEMTAMFALGFSLRHLYCTLLTIAIPLGFLLLVLQFLVLPYTANLQYVLQAEAREEAQLTIFKAGIFRELMQGRYVVYVGKLTDEGQQLEDIFIRSIDETGTEAITLAANGRQHIDEMGVRFLELSHGLRYQNQPAGNSHILKFDHMTLRLDQTEVERPLRTEALSTQELWQQDNNHFAIAELQRRFSTPISLLILVLIIPILAHVPPRSGRFSRLLVGVMLYVLYFNLLGISEAWMKKQLISPWLGMWWVHVVMLVLGVWITYKRGIK